MLPLSKKRSGNGVLGIIGLVQCALLTWLTNNNLIIMVGNVLCMNTSAELTGFSFKCCSETVIF